MEIQSNPLLISSIPSILVPFLPICVHPVHLWLDVFHLIPGSFEDENENEED